MGMSGERVTLMEAQVRRREAEMAVRDHAVVVVLLQWLLVVGAVRSSNPKNAGGCGDAECGAGWGWPGAAHARGESNDGADDRGG